MSSSTNVDLCGLTKANTPDKSWMNIPTPQNFMHTKDFWNVAFKNDFFSNTTPPTSLDNIRDLFTMKEDEIRDLMNQYQWPVCNLPIFWAAARVGESPADECMREVKHRAFSQVLKLLSVTDLEVAYIMTMYGPKVRLWGYIRRDGERGPAGFWPLCPPVGGIGDHSTYVDVRILHVGFRVLLEALRCAPRTGAFIRDFSWDMVMVGTEQDNSPLPDEKSRLRPMHVHGREILCLKNDGSVKSMPSLGWSPKIAQANGRRFSYYAYPATEDCPFAWMRAWRPGMSVG